MSSQSGVILAFAFMIGAASSKYFEGLLFILVRRPFSIGDGIALSGVNEQTSSTGVSPSTSSLMCPIIHPLSPSVMS
jgi:hypothetical protein